MVCIIYARVSTEEQVRHGFSLQAQLAEGVEHARSTLGYSREEILEITDEGISGEILARPGLTHLRELVRTGGVGHVVTKDLDRLSRQLVHQLLLTEEIEKNRTRLEFLTFDWQDTPEGRLFLALRGAIAQFEKEKIRERTMAGKFAKAKQGGLTHFPGTYGYSWDKEADLFVLNERQAEVVRLIYQWFTEESKTPNEIAKALNAAGIQSPRGRLWSRVTVKRILINPAYYGHHVQHKWDKSGVKLNRHRPPGEQVKARLRPPEEHLIAMVPAIVSEDKWLAAQEKIVENQGRRPGIAARSYELSGLATCGLCGRTLHGNAITNGKGKTYRYYVCAGRSPGVHGRARCELPFIRTEPLEETTWSWVCRCLTNSAILLEALSVVGSADERPLEFAVAETQLRELTRERARVIALYQRGLVADLEVDSLLASIDSRRTGLEGMMRSRSPMNAWHQGGPAAVLAEAEKCIINADPETRRCLVRCLVKRITILTGEIRIEARVRADRHLPAQELCDHDSMAPGAPL